MMSRFFSACRLSLLFAVLLLSAPSFAGTGRRAEPTDAAPAKADQLTSFFASHLRLTPMQSQSLRQYLKQEVRQLNLLALMQPDTAPDPEAPTEMQQLDGVMARLCTPAQLAQYQVLKAQPLPVSCFKAMGFME